MEMYTINIASQSTGVEMTFEMSTLRTPEEQ